MMAPQGAPVAEPALSDDSARQERAERFSSPIHAYRRLMVAALLLPLMLLLAAMGWMQYRTQRNSLLVEQQALAQKRLNELDEMTAAAVEHVSNMRHWMEADFAAAPPTYPSELLKWLQPRLLDGKVDGYSLDGLRGEARAYLGQFMWVAPRPPTQDDLNRFAYFSGPASMAHALKPFFAWSYFFSSQADAIIIYPWTPARTVVEEQGQVSMRKAMLGWLDYDVYRKAMPQFNPRREAYWVAPYVDAGGKGLMVSHAAPIYQHDGQFRGMVGTDLLLSTLQAKLEAWRKDQGRWLVITAQKELLADSGQDVLAAVRGELVPHLADRLPPGVSAEDVQRAATQPGKPYELAQGVLLVNASRHAPWQLIRVMPEGAIRAAMLPHLMPYAQMSLLILLAFFLGHYLVQRNVMSPALEVLDYLMRRIKTDKVRKPRVNALWKPVFDMVAANFDAQRVTQQSQRRSEALKSAVVDNALFAIVTTDETGTIVEFNPAAEQMFALPRGHALGRKVSDLIVPPRYRQAHLDGMARLRGGGMPRVIGKRVEMEALRADGTELPMEMVLARSEIDGEVFYSALMTDLSERRRVAEEVDRQREALRQSEKLTTMGSLLAGVAHELNNPLAILMGRATLLEGKSHDPDLRADAQRIREAAERCGRIVRTFLNMARNQRGEHRPVQLNDMVRGAADLLAYSLRTNGVEVVFELAPDLPEILADGDQIGQVVLNLLVNAEQVQGVSRIRMGTGATHDAAGVPTMVWLRVTDDGPGVPDELVQRIFDPFFTTKPLGCGTGLGLSVSRAIARDHGGDLVVETPQPGRGASFLLRLPARQPEAGQVPALSSRELDEPGETSAFLARILVVDDEQELADVMRDMLESQGYEVFCAESAAVALQMLDEAPCDLVLSDLRMPVMDGPAFWRALTEHHPELAHRVVFVTGDTLSPGAREFLEETGCDFIEKPFTQAELMEKVRAGLGGAP
jgi:two-component system NtrC family sensor kinase